MVSPATTQQLGIARTSIHPAASQSIHALKTFHDRLWLRDQTMM